ncbi:efflux ABC transporter permease/ATP-binding protein [Nitzschia inconspicua]|uniref:Efflux ABC transporter permease/ATP-binding protein n=1 Tax=Nitzschia inconspicua TaxID=303405 RepID=A0A9K3Q5Z5_9STRA|nr:efflux ABC transporter permease/ATP-binding protein [Nitzschia inconspicua]
MAESSKDPAAASSPGDCHEEEEVSETMEPPLPLPKKMSSFSYTNNSNSDCKQQDDNEKKDMYQLASIHEVFSYGTGWIKVSCLTLGFLLAMISGAVAPTMVFYFAKAFQDLVADPQDERFMEQVKELAFTFLVLGVIAFCSLCGYATLLETSAGNMTKDFQQKWFRALLRQDMAFFDIQDVSGVATLISTNGTRYKRGVGVKLGLFVQFICTFIGGCTYAFYSSWTTSLVVLCTVPFMAVSGWFVVKMTTTTTQRANAAYAKAGSVAYTTASSIRTILSLNAVSTMIDQYVSATAEAFRSNTHQVGWLGFAGGCMMASFLLSSIVVPLYGGSLLWNQIQETNCDPSGAVFSNETCDPKAMEIFGAMFGIFLSASVLPQLSTILESFTQARVACFLAHETMNRNLGNTVAHAGGREFSKLADGPPAEMVKSGDEESNSKSIVTRCGQHELPEYKIDSMSKTIGLKPKKFKGEIEFDGVTFAYPTRQEIKVFDNFSLKIKAGSTVAICGPSGSGKSTIIQLLERFYDVQGGSIKIDSHDIRDLNVNWLRQHIGLVQQEPKLFGTTIGANIRYGKPDALLVDLEKAAKAANAHQFIESFPDGYKTQVGDLGGKLSGGQKQRIAIARVLICHPKILLLDEATSALDTESELQVQKSLDKLLKSKKNKRTTIIIAHRLSTIRHADTIVVFKGGKVVELGTHDDLMERKEEYFHLVQNQTRIKDNMEQKELVDEASLSHSSSSEGAIFFRDDKTLLQFQNVYFSYPTRPEKEVISNLNLSVKRGENLALVGPSGEGKSSIIALLQRFYSPDRGSILIDGVDLQNINVSWWHSQVALVGQDPVLFDMTIGENIAFGMDTSVTQEHIEEAAKEANCHDFITEFPDGYNTRVTSGLVSGGQKQRICIARALLRKPKILLLDEATSALDSESEKVVQQSIDKITAREDLTCITIAHRLSSIQKVDRIAVVDGGKVKEIGTYEELIAKPKGYFRRLQMIQIGDSEVAAVKSKTYRKKREQLDEDKDNPAATEEFLVDKEKEMAIAKRARLLARQDTVYYIIGGIGAVLAGAVFPAWGFIFAYTIELLYQPVYSGLDQRDYDAIVDDMKSLAANIAYGSLGTILATLIGNVLLYYGFGVATERMNQRVRNDAFKSLARQECGYFDSHPVGSLTSRLQDDAALLHSFSGAPIRALIVSLASVFVGLVIGFYYLWPFALVFLGILPFLGFGAEMEMQMYITGEDEGDDTVEDEHSPGGIVVESLLNIRTIASLTMEEVKLEEYSDALQHQDSHPLWNNFVKGSGSGLGQFFQFWGIALMFWFGAWLLNKFPENYSFRDFVISMYALFFSLYGLTVAFENATDRNQAKLAAERIFSLTDRTSAIDPLDESGDRPDHIFAPAEKKEHHHSKTHHHHHHHKKKSNSKKRLEVDPIEMDPNRKEKSNFRKLPETDKEKRGTIDQHHRKKTTSKILLKEAKRSSSKNTM